MIDILINYTAAIYNYDILIIDPVFKEFTKKGPRHLCLKCTYRYCPIVMSVHVLTSLLRACHMARNRKQSWDSQRPTPRASNLQNYADESTIIKVLKSVKLCTSVLYTKFQLYTMSFYKVKRFSLTGRTSEANTWVEISLNPAVRLHDKGYLNHVEILASLNIIEEILTCAFCLIAPRTTLL